MNAAKVALITGSSSGIGAATAVHFASLRYKLSLTGRNKQRLEDVRDKCIAKGLSSTDVIITVADMTSLQDIQTLVSKTVEAHRRIDVLINNAGAVAGFKEIENVTDDEFNYLLDLMLKAPFRLSQLAMPYLLQTKGNIINVSSIAGDIVFPKTNMYGICKAGLNHMTRGMALELGPKGVRVNTISPGLTITTIFDTVGMPLQKAEETFCPKIPVGRFAKAEEIAKAIAFLVDEETSSYITGHNLTIDGALPLVF